MVNVRFYPSVTLRPVDSHIRSRIREKHPLVRNLFVVVSQIG